MKKMKKAILCVVLVLSFGTMLVGCGKHVATYEDLQKAEERYNNGEIGQMEYYEIQDAYMNGDKIDNEGSFLGTVGKIIVVVAIAGGVFVFIKKKKETK